jgi:hypothetical protein
MEVAERAKGRCLNSQAAQRPIGHAGGWMACLSDAPVLILTAEDAVPPPITMAVWTAAAQGQCRCSH